MTDSKLRGKIEDFLWYLEMFQMDNTSQEVEDLCDVIVNNLDTLDEMLSKQEALG